MEQARIEHAPNGSLLTYITSADALVNKKIYEAERVISIDTIVLNGVENCHGQPVFVLYSF